MSSQELKIQAPCNWLQHCPTDTVYGRFCNNSVLVCNFQLGFDVKIKQTQHKFRN